MLRFSPRWKFLNIATSVLKVAVRLIKFRCRLPIAPAVPGLAKQAVLIKYGEPSGANVPGRLFGSQTTTGRALMSPPVKSVMVWDEHWVVEVAMKPGAHAPLVVFVYVPVEKVQFRPVPLPKVLGLPVA